jgi:hypothetical protein
MSKSYTNRHGHGSGFCSLAYETSGKSRKLITCGSDTLIKVPPTVREPFVWPSLCACVTMNSLAGCVKLFA